MTKFAPTKVADDYYIDNKLFAKKFGEAYVMNEPLARKSVSFDDMETFMAFKKKLGSTVFLTDNFAKFFNPKTRFDAFLSEGLADGVELTEEEQAIRPQLEALRQKFEATFGGITHADLRVFAPDPKGYDTQEVRDFFANRDVDAPVPGVLNVRDILRVVHKGKAVQVKNGGDYRINLKRMEQIWNSHLKKAWENAKVNSERLNRWHEPSFSLAGYYNELEVYGDHIKFGCQRTSRWAIERLAKEQGWAM